MSKSVLDQPCAFKLVYQPDDHYANDHCFVKDDNGLWHLFYIYMANDVCGIAEHTTFLRAARISWLCGSMKR